jgi:hypothetical protein
MEGGGAAVGGGEANRRPSGNLPLRCASPAGYCAPSPDMAAGFVVGFLQWRSQDFYFGYATQIVFENSKVYL